MKAAWIAGAALVAGVLSFGPARAMEIRQFDKMISLDRSEYISSLISGTEHILADEGRPDLAIEIHRLFLVTPAGDEMALGMTELTSNIDRARVADAERAEKDPAAHRVHVEDAMLVTLKKNNIPMSDEFVRAVRGINAGFQPKSPLQK